MILVDTDVLIAHLRGIKEAHDWLVEARTSTGPLSISAVTLTELTGGMRANEKRDVWRLLGTLRLEPATELVARQAGEFMRKYQRSHSGIALADYLIAGTAEVRGLELATLNVRHFPMFPRLKPPFKIGC